MVRIYVGMVRGEHIGCQKSMYIWQVMYYMGTKPLSLGLCVYVREK